MPDHKRWRQRQQSGSVDRHTEEQQPTERGSRKEWEQGTIAKKGKGVRLTEQSFIF